jgi:hypothetical protein
VEFWWAPIFRVSATTTSHDCKLSVTDGWVRTQSVIGYLSAGRQACLIQKEHFWNFLKKVVIARVVHPADEDR